MRLAIKKARQGIGEGQAPFACCIVKDGSILACEHNKVWSRKDITAHAEVVAIQEACRKIKAINLNGCVIYTTCEPCPMCFGAIHWAKISKIVFGARVEDAAKIGFSELPISNEQIKELGDAPVEIQGGFLKEEAQVLFEQYKEIVGSKIY